MAWTPTTTASPSPPDKHPSPLNLSYRPAPARDPKNTIPRFQVFDDTAPPLLDSPSPLRADAWKAALRDYPDPGPSRLADILASIVNYGALIGYEGPPQTGPQDRILSDNLRSAENAPDLIDQQLQVDLKLGRVVPTPTYEDGTPVFPFISSPVGLVPKSDGGFRRIHHLSHPVGRSVNDGIHPDHAALIYTAVDGVFDAVRRAGKGAIIAKHDLKDAFRTIAVAPSQYWLLGFFWLGIWYTETCLSFGLRTAPFIFNLFAEAFHWILLSSAPAWWKLQLVHYLDDFIAVLPPGSDPAPYSRFFERFTQYLGLVNNPSKAASGCIVECLGIEINTTNMTARLPAKKIDKATRLVTETLARGTLTHHEAEQLAGFLGFCSGVIPLGRLYLCRMWAFMRSHRHPGAHRPLTSGARADLTWWQDVLSKTTGIRLIDDGPRRSVYCFTDASSVGLGGFWFEAPLGTVDWKRHASQLPVNQAFSVRRPDADLPVLERQHINTAEIIALAEVLHRALPDISHTTVELFTDNATAQAAFGSGATRGESNLEALRPILLLAAAHDVNLHVRRVASDDNELADALSRFDRVTIANYCPQWELNSAGHRTKGIELGSRPVSPHVALALPATSGQGSNLVPTRTTAPALRHTKLGASLEGTIPGRPPSTLCYLGQ